MNNILQNDLNEILPTGAGRAEVKQFLISKGHDLQEIEKALATIPFEGEPVSSDPYSPSASKGNGKIALYTIASVVLMLLSFILHRVSGKRKYAEINVTICNISKVPVMVETNLSKSFCSRYVNGGCSGGIIGDELPIDFLYSENRFLKISVNGKSYTNSNILERARVTTGRVEEGFFSDTEMIYLDYNITQADVDQCK